MAEDGEPDNDHAEAGDRRRRYRLAEQEPAAERGDHGADVEHQTRPGCPDLVDQSEVVDVGDRAGQHAEVAERDDRADGPVDGGDRFAGPEAEAVEQEGTDRQRPRRPDGARQPAFSPADQHGPERETHRAREDDRRPAVDRLGHRRRRDVDHKPDADEPDQRADRARCREAFVGQ